MADRGMWAGKIPLRAANLRVSFLPLQPSGVALEEFPLGIGNFRPRYLHRFALAVALEEFPLGIGNFRPRYLHRFALAVALEEFPLGIGNRNPSSQLNLAEGWLVSRGGEYFCFLLLHYHLHQAMGGSKRRKGRPIFPTACLDRFQLMFLVTVEGKILV